MRGSRQRHHLAARAGEALAEIETQHLVDALKSDVNKGTVERDRFGVEPAARGDRPAVRSEQRCGLDVVEPDHLAAPIDDAAGEPASVIADGDEALALGVQPQSRQPAKAGKARSQDQPAAIFQRPEPHTLMVAGVERAERPGIDLDRNRRFDRVLAGDQLRGRLGCQLRPRDRRHRKRRKPRRRRFQETSAGEMFTPHGEEARLRRLEP